MKLSLVPLSGTYSFAVSFCLPLCDCGFCFTGCWIVVLPAAALCPVVGESVSETCAGCMAGETGNFPEAGRTRSCFSGGQGGVRECVYWAAIYSGRF